MLKRHLADAVLLRRNASPQGVNDETLSKGIVLAPNPASQYVDLTFNLEKSATLDVKILNTVGQVVLTKKMDSILRGVEKLDISDLQPGIYIVEIAEGARRTNKKLVINR